jgi:hypothetical protein
VFTYCEENEEMQIEFFTFYILYKCMLATKEYAKTNYGSLTY